MYSSGAVERGFRSEDASGEEEVGVVAPNARGEEMGGEFDVAGLLAG